MSVLRLRESRRDFGSCDVSGEARARVAGGSSPAPCRHHSASLNVTSTNGLNGLNGLTTCLA